MTTTTENYFEAIGKRKTARARVRLTAAARNTFVLNDKTLEEYLPTKELQMIAREPLAHIDNEAEGTPKIKYKISVQLSGGGIHSQAEALRLGLSRALLKAHAELRSPLRKAHLLTRDPRIKERRKFGLKKARKSPQWSKR